MWKQLLDFDSKEATFKLIKHPYCVPGLEISKNSFPDTIPFENPDTMTKITVLFPGCLLKCSFWTWLLPTTDSVGRIMSGPILVHMAVGVTTVGQHGHFLRYESDQSLDLGYEPEAGMLKNICRGKAKWQSKAAG